ncbi:MAG TPA: SH3 domain-containing protein [Dehalococcoidia bacterium]|nr:SH3 domain-containing protein [Dehalococcoidia bacterium]
MTAAEEESGRPPSSSSFFLGLAIGMVLGVGIALAALALVALAGDEQQSSPLVVAPTPQPQPGAATPTPDPRPRAAASVNVRTGPSNDFAVLGVLGGGQAVDIVGRDASSAWLAIRFPPGSTSTGWVPANVLEGLPDVNRLAIVQATPVPQTFRPPTGASGGVAPLTPGAPPVPTPTPVPLPDLVVLSASLRPDGRVSAVVGNTGGRMEQTFFFVQFIDRRGQAEMVTVTQSVAQGGAVTVVSDTFRPRPGEAVRITVNPFGDMREASTANNTLETTLAAATPPPS